MRNIISFIYTLLMQVLDRAAINIDFNDWYNHIAILRGVNEFKSRQGAYYRHKRKPFRDDDILHEEVYFHFKDCHLVEKNERKHCYQINGLYFGFISNEESTCQLTESDHCQWNIDADVSDIGEVISKEDFDLAYALFKRTPTVDEYLKKGKS